MEKIKVVFITVFSTLSSLFGALAIPVVLLVLCNIIDYITGLAAVRYRKQQISSYTSIRGIIKKVCMWLLIAVGALMDRLILYACSEIGFIMPFTFAIACVVAIWLICNEIISILENINDIGVPMPAFMKTVVQNIKSQIEDKTESEDKTKLEESEREE